jgi:tRNA threonylcarbamoyladenosine biosynthesis protein TsaE
MKKEIITENYKQTQRIGQDLAKKIIKNKLPKKATILALKGNLGSGKTTFLQGFAKGLDIKEKILSPTFVIMKKFKITKNKFNYFYHFDCYRFDNSKEIFDLGFKKIINDPKNIISIEWPDKIKKVLPKKIFIIEFKFIEENKREINLKI